MFQKSHAVDGPALHDIKYPRFPGGGGSKPLILYIPCIILVIGHIHKKCTQYNINYIQILVDSKHVSAPRCHPQGVTNTKQYTLQAPTHKIIALLTMRLYN